VTSTQLLSPLAVGPAQAPNRVLFGPHETNLGRGRALSERHLAYYRRRAQGGCGTIVVETASVHPSDWPYERAPAVEECAAGWAAIATALHEEGALALASLGHAGGQGSSAYHQRALWSPGGFPDPVTREVPQIMEDEEIASLVGAFGTAAQAVRASGLDGAEINAGQHSLLRQFLSGLTNDRVDGYGADRTRLVREVLVAARRGLGDRVLGLRLGCDELAPWAGITLDLATEIALSLEGLFDYVVAVRAPAFDTGGTRPDGHTEPGFALPLARRLRAALRRGVVVAQGSIVDVEMAEAALVEGDADLVEMTRAQIAEPDLVRKLRQGRGGRIRPCVLCNQRCQVRDVRNPIVSCIGEPSAGHEDDDADVAPLTWSRSEPRPGVPGVLVVGAGPAGLETARVAAGLGRPVRVIDARAEAGGRLRLGAVGPGHHRLGRLADWLESECRVLGVEFELGRTATPAELEALGRDGTIVVCCHGSAPAPDRYPSDETVRRLRAGELFEVWADDGTGLPAGRAVVEDLVGDSVGVAAAELLAGSGRTVALVTADLVAGLQLSTTGDLAPANARLARAGVSLRKQSVVVEVCEGAVVLEDRPSGQVSRLEAELLVEAGYAWPAPPLVTRGSEPPTAGDAVAPRSVYEAVLEGRRVALALGAP
jgi:2,4-dienoyl-CoA reductase (NADPH2)